MKINKENLNKGLQSYYSTGHFIAGLMSKVWTVRLMNFFSKALKSRKIKGLNSDQRYIRSQNGGPDIRVRIFRPINSSKDLPAMLYIHGGGYMLGNPETALESITDFVKTRDCVVVAPDYRKSIANPYPAGFNDSYDTLLWMKENAAELSICKDKFMIAGHSAGGGMTAALCLKARDTKEVEIAFQLPIYPMIDDCQQSESAQFIKTPVWDAKSNAFAWRRYLKDLKASNELIPPYAAPARADNYANLPPTITFVGDMEPFRDETIAYVEALKRANVPVQFQLYQGCFHAFEQLLPKSEIAQEARQFLLKAFGEYYDLYFE